MLFNDELQHPFGNCFLSLLRQFSLTMFICRIEDHILRFKKNENPLKQVSCDADLDTKQPSAHANRLRF